MLPQEILDRSLDLNNTHQDQEPPVVNLHESDEEPNQQLLPPPPNSPQAISHLDAGTEIVSMTSAELTNTLSKNLNFPIGVNFLEILEAILRSNLDKTREVTNQHMQIPPFEKITMINRTTSAHLIGLRANIEEVNKQLEERNRFLSEKLRRMQLEVEREEKMLNANQVGLETEGVDQAGPPLNMKLEVRSDKNCQKKTGRKLQPPFKRDRSESWSAPPADSEAAGSSARLHGVDDDDDDDDTQPVTVPRS